MISYPDTPDRLTTDQLLSEAAQLTGYTATPVQLRHWVKYGLLPKAEQRYPGRGEGSVALWVVEALPRLIIILHARGGRGGKNVSLTRAAALLAVLGWPPTNARPLRDVLYDYLDTLERAIQPGRAFQKVPERSDMQQRFLRSIRGRNKAVTMHGLPLATRTSLLRGAAAMAGVSDPDSADPLERLGQYCSPEALRTVVGETSDEDLLRAYAQASSLLGDLAPWLEASIQTVDKAWNDQPLRSRYTDALPHSDDFGLAEVLMLPVTLVCVTYQYNAKHMQTLTEQAEPILRHIFRLTEQSGKGADAPQQTASTRKP